MERSQSNMWSRDEAHVLCGVLESIAVKHGCHVGLTGGVLYKSGARKDCDVVVYRAGLAGPTGADGRAPFHEEIDRDALIGALEFHGFVLVKEYTRVVKLRTSDGKSVDLIFPECDGAYEEEVGPDPDLAMEKARDDKALTQMFVDPVELGL